MVTEVQTELQSEVQTQKKSNMLATVLRADGVFALLSGAVLIVAAGPVTGLIDLSNSLPLVVLGVVLLLYGGDLLYFAGREPINRRVAQAAIILNMLWVIGSYLGLLMGWFPVNTAGKWAIALVAEVVLVFAVLEFIALRRSR
jgi:hypothetical protein